MISTKYKTVSEYFKSLTKEQRLVLEKFRHLIREIIPDAEEIISYNMPSFKLNEVIVWYAIYKKHIGFYPKTAAIKYFDKALKGYKTSKGAIQFPLDKKIPEALVKKIVKFRIKESLENDLNNSR